MEGIGYLGWVLLIGFIVFAIGVGVGIDHGTSNAKKAGCEFEYRVKDVRP